MNRPPRKQGPRGPKPIVANFDADDRELIEGACSARIKGGPLSPVQIHVCQIIDHAARQFVGRIRKMFPHGLPANPDDPEEQILFICKPATFFDDYVTALVLQELGNLTGHGVARAMQLPGPNPSRQFGRCPDVIFPNYTPPTNPDDPENT